MARYGVSSSAARRSNVASSGGRSPATSLSLLMLSSSRSLPAAAAHAQSLTLVTLTTNVTVQTANELRQRLDSGTQRLRNLPCKVLLDILMQAILSSINSCGCDPLRLPWDSLVNVVSGEQRGRRHGKLLHQRVEQVRHFAQPHLHASR